MIASPLKGIGFESSCTKQQPDVRWRSVTFGHELGGGPGEKKSHTPPAPPRPPRGERTSQMQTELREMGQALGPREEKPKHKNSNS